MNTMRCVARWAIPALMLAFSGCNGTGPAGGPPLSWEQPDWVPNAVIYEVFVPDFSHEGTFRGAAARVNELKEMGITTLWLMPIHPIGVEGRKGVLGSPYAVRDYYGINPDYGTAEDFRYLVDTVHEAGLKIIIDLVANHTAPDNAWTKEHPDWYTKGPDGNPTTPISPEGEPTDWTDTVDLNYDSPGLREEMIRMLRYWIEEFDIDGYRCDVATWVPYDFWKDAIDALRELKPIMMLAESDDIRIHDSGFDLTYAWPEYGKLKEVWEGEPVSELTDLVETIERELPDGTGRLRFTTNHDETAWDAPPPEIFGGKQGAEAAYVLTSSLPGAPLLYTGQETGVETTVTFFDRFEYDWSANRDVARFFSSIFEFYNSSDVMKRGSVSFPTPDENDIAIVERSLDGKKLIVAVNVRNRESATTLPTSLAGMSGREVFTGLNVTFPEEFVLGPHAYQVVAIE